MQTKTAGYPWLGTANITLGFVLLLFFIVFVPWKNPLLSLLFILLGLAALVAGWGLLRATPWGKTTARILSRIAIGAGLLLTTGCLFSASYLAGIYGGLGRTAAGLFLFFVFVVLLVLVLLPTIQLRLLGQNEQKK